MAERTLLLSRKGSISYRGWGAPLVKLLLKGTNVLEVCVSSRRDTLSSSKSPRSPPWAASVQTRERCWEAETRLPLITGHSPQTQMCPKAEGPSRDDQEKVLVEPRPEDEKSGSAEGAYLVLIQKKSSKVHSANCLLITGL